MHHGPSYRSAADLLRSVVGCHPHRIEPPIEGFQLCPRMHPHPDSRGRPMFHPDGNTDRNLSFVTEWLQRQKASRLHQTNHVGS